jgi:hypothetical protein
VPGRKEKISFALRTWRLCAFALNPGQLGREPLQTDVGKCSQTSLFALLLWNKTELFGTDYIAKSKILSHDR